MESAINVRHAEPADADVIAHIHLTSWQAQFIPIMTAEHIARKNLHKAQEIARWQKRLTKEHTRLTLVASHAAQGVGYISGGKEQDGTLSYESELYQIYVLPEAQGQGIGRRLVHELAKTLDATGFRSMLVWVMTKNPAVKFYRETLGGIYVAERPIPEVDGQLHESAYGWLDLPALIERTKLH